MIRLLFDSYSIDCSIDRKELLTDQNSKTEIFCKIFWWLFKKVEEVLSFVNGFMKHLNSPYVPFDEI